ncbi:MAG: hypothetical protein JJ900_06665 [Rhodospirillales bacterium]|nr:hypothetical protein [Rhodospirillales bacterium]
MKVLLYDPNLEFLGTIRNVLRESGFGDISSTNTPEAVRVALDCNEVDLLIGYAHAEDNALCTIIKDVRDRRLGENPFPVVIGLTDDKHRDSMTKVVNAGFDGLALKPLDPPVFRKRIEYFLQKRKPFVATADYIGPDRRQDIRSAEAFKAQMNVPNPVKIIAEGTSRTMMMQQVSEVSAALDERKILSDVRGVNWIAGKMTAANAVGNAKVLESGIRQLDMISHDIDWRLNRTIYRHVRELCDSLLEVSGRLMESMNKPNGKDIEDLRDLAQKILNRCDAEHPDTIRAREGQKMPVAHA